MAAISRKSALAIEAVLYVALNAVDRTVRSGEITQRQNVPQRYLEPVLQALVREGVMVGVRGPRGGYKLARERRRITQGLPSRCEVRQRAIISSCGCQGWLV